MRTKPIITAFMAFALMSLNINIAATGSSSRSTSSSSSRSSSSFNSSKPSSTFGSTKPSAPSITTPKSSTSTFGSTKNTPSATTSAPTPSKPNAAISSFNTQSRITPTQTREQIVSDFKTKNAQTYTNSFKSEPAQRPTYIPQTYQNHTVVYNTTLGGYGYYDGGRWMLYDALNIAAHNAAISSSYTYHQPQVVVASTGSGTALLQVFLAFIVIGIIFAAFYLLLR